MFIPFKKSTLLIPSSPDNLRDIKHLFIILTNPLKTQSSAKVLLVNISSVKNSKYIFDDACIIESGEHKFIKHQSFVHYRYARIEDVSQLIKKVKIGEFIQHDAVTDTLYFKVVNGLFRSKFVASKFLAFYNKYCNIK